MKKIELTQGKVALVDDEDYDFVNQWKWQAAKWQGGFYAVRSEYIGGGSKNPKFKRFKMHRVILQAKDGFDVDHRDTDGLNNQRYNLRQCTRIQNKQNGKPYKGGTSAYKGVCFIKKRKRWVSAITFNKKRFQIGYFKDEICAAKAYDLKARELFGEYARTNFPETE